jgi:hypothetical protein
LLREWYEHEYRVLLGSNDLEDIYRAQGALRILGQILQLPVTIREYNHDVTTGKRTKIQEDVHGLDGQYQQEKGKGSRPV